MIIKEDDFIVASLYDGDKLIKTKMGGQYSCLREVINDVMTGIDDFLERYTVIVENRTTDGYGRYDGFGDVINERDPAKFRRINMQVKYDILKENIERDGVLVYDDDGVGKHTPTVVEYVRHLLLNDDGFLKWLFDDDKELTFPDLEPEEIEMYHKFLDYCR